MNSSLFHARASMIRSLFVSLLLLSLIISAPKSLALGDFDGEAGAFWWLVDPEDLLDTSLNTNAAGAYANIWWRQAWGIQTALYRIDKGKLNGAPDRQLVVNLERRLLSATDNTYLAAGLGWEENRFGEEGSASGGRVSADARIGLLGALYVYGKAGWAPDLKNLGQRRDISSVSVETGLVLDPLPFLSLRAAYRYHITDYTEAGTSTDRRESSYGIIFGGGVHW
jgi:hypothetical protein